MPTESARMLTRFAENYLQASASFLEQLNLEYESMNGWVRYAMPESCIHSPHFPMLLQRRKQFPDMELDVHLQSTELVSAACWRVRSILVSCWIGDLKPRSICFPSAWSNTSWWHHPNWHPRSRCPTYRTCSKPA